MREKVSSVFAAVVLIVLSVFLAVEGTDAFCIYNFSDVTIAVKQTSGGKAF